MFHSGLTKILYVDHMRGRVVHGRWMFQAESEGGGMEQTVKHQTAWFTLNRSSESLPHILATIKTAVAGILDMLVINTK